MRRETKNTAPRREEPTPKLKTPQKSRGGGRKPKNKQPDVGVFGYVLYKPPQKPRRRKTKKALETIGRRISSSRVALHCLTHGEAVRREQGEPTGDMYTVSLVMEHGWGSTRMGHGASKDWRNFSPSNSLVRFSRREHDSCYVSLESRRKV